MPKQPNQQNQQKKQQQRAKQNQEAPAMSFTQNSNTQEEQGTNRQP